ncbi:DUF4156 domain-containing protein [Vibrio fortis]|jgi:hypothetical protein|uniref:DUF4156 domain-containing protein n=1 Tax=Vibrio fortis TaxID=212667 RepID=UPI0021C335ED|nr:DUF4156 domain-containing protein [Vibrio fortis]
MKLRWLGLLIMGMLVGCTTPTKLPHKQADQVKMDYHGILDISHCTYKGVITGSEGHWYSYLFFPNDTLVQGAINELKSNAIAIDANTVLFTLPQDFVTSVTLLGTGYDCP